MYYILEDKVPKRVTREEWVNDGYVKISSAPYYHRVKRTEIDDILISTVFTGVNSCWDDEQPPLVFETRVFNGPMDGWCDRYSTWEEAEKGHQEIVEKVNQTLFI